VIGAASGQSDASGQVTFDVSSSAAHVTTFTATDTTENPDVVITETAAVEFFAGYAVEADVARCHANDTDVVTITVTVLDDAGDPVVGSKITLAASANGGGVTIDQAFVNTDANGQAVFTAHSTTLHGVAAKTVLTATDETANPDVVIGDTVSIEFYGTLAANEAKVAFQLRHNEPWGLTKKLKVTSTPQIGGNEITCTKVGGAAWLSVPATFTHNDLENVALVEGQLPKRMSFKFNEGKETLRFSGAGFDPIDVEVTYQVKPG